MSKFVFPRDGHQIHAGYDRPCRNYFAQVWTSDGEILFDLGIYPEYKTADDLRAALAEKLTETELPSLTDDEARQFDTFLDNSPHQHLAVAITELCDAIKTAEKNQDNLGVQDALVGSQNISDVIEYLAAEKRLEGLSYSDETGELTGTEGGSTYHEADPCTGCGRYRVEHRNRILWPAACETYTHG